MDWCSRTGEVNEKFIDDLCQDALDVHGCFAVHVKSVEDARVLNRWFEGWQVLRTLQEKDGTNFHFVYCSDFLGIFLQPAFLVHGLPMRNFSKYLVSPAAMYQLFKGVQKLEFNKDLGKTQGPHAFARAAAQAALSSSADVKSMLTITDGSLCCVGLDTSAVKKDSMFNQLSWEMLKGRTHQLGAAALLCHHQVTETAQTDDKDKTSALVNSRYSIIKAFSDSRLVQFDGESSRTDALMLAEAWAKLFLPLPLMAWKSEIALRLQALRKACDYVKYPERYEASLLRHNLLTEVCPLAFFTRIRAAVQGVHSSADVISLTESLMTAAPIPVEWRLSALAKLNTCLKPQQQYMQLSAVLAMPAEERVENLITKMTEDRTVNSLTSSHPPSANGGNTLVRAFPPPSHLLEGTCSRRETGHTPERRRLFLPSLFRRWGFCLCFFPRIMVLP